MAFIVKYIAVFAVSLIMAWLLVPLVKKLAPRLGLVDEPSARRIHQAPTPRCGGIALFFTVHLALALVFLGPWQNLAGATQLREWGFIGTGSLMLFLVGLADDHYDISAGIKLLAQLAVGLLMFSGGFTFEAFLGIPLPLAVNLGATLFWFALLVNAFNLIDGMDGACAGLGLIASAGLAGMLLSLHQVSDALVLIALAGACLGFLRYNFHPASIFLGDCGSMFIGFMLAAVSLKANVKQSMMVALLVPLLAVGVPVFDVILTVWRRLARKLVALIRHDELATKIFGPDLDHIHHKLMRSGMTQRKAAVMLYIAALLICMVALTATALADHRGALLMIGMIVALHVIVRQMAQIELWTTTQVVLQGIHRPRNMVGLLLAIGWDISWLLLSTWFVFHIALGRLLPVMQLAVCVMIPFATVYFYGIYKTVWTRARDSQLLVLALQLLAGEALAGVALFWTSGFRPAEIMIALALHSVVAALGIVGIRASMRVVRDLGAWLRGAADSDHDLKALILGGGENAILYLRQASFEEQQNAPRKVVGLIDDNPVLRHKAVFGYPVLGNFSELEKVVQEQGINELIFTHHYSDELRAQILGLKSKYGLLIRDFIFVLRDLDETGACRGSVRPWSVHELDCGVVCARPEPDGAEAASPGTF